MARTHPLIVLLAAAPACGQLPTARTAPAGPLTFEVWVHEQGAEVGDPDPLPFDPGPAGARTFHVDVRALGSDGLLLDSYDGTAHLRAVPAVLDTSDTVTFSGGFARDVPVTVQMGYGDVRIWVEDTGDGETPGSYATGASSPIRFHRPTAADAQRTASSLTSPLDGRNVTLRTDDRQLVVTGVVQDGFYATDLAEPNGAFASLFVFNFNRPRDLETGDRVVDLNGNIYEYLGFTELQYPSWQVDGALEPPAPVRIDDALCAEDDLDLEQWESAKVEVGPLESAFDDGDVAEACASYAEYGQWPARLSGSSCARLTVVNQYTVPDLKFDACLHDAPSQPAPVALAGLKGHLRQNQYADYSEWILEVSDCDDLVDPGDRARWCPDEGLAARTALHYSGPRPGPRAVVREHPDCSGVWYPLDAD